MYENAYTVRTALQQDTLQKVTSSENDNVVDDGLADGYYSVDIDVLHETKEEASMAAEFFNKTGLPLRIQNGKAYLTIQVIKDGKGMTNVITAIEQRINGIYRDLRLNYLNDNSVRYITAEVEFDEISDYAYLRTDITAMAGMKPVLRIKLDESSITEGAGSIDTTLSGDIVAVSKVVAENGKVTITLSGEDEELTADQFTGKVYLDGDTKGTELELKDFKIEGTSVTFTYDAIAQTEKEQSVVIGITYGGTETKAEAFKVEALNTINPNLTQIKFKENVTSIKYIKGYEDGTFRPNGKLTKAETLSMLSLLVNTPQREYYTTDIKVLQSEKDETSMAAQFFTTEDVKVIKQNDYYLVEMEIANEGLGFSDIITSIEMKVNGTYEPLQVRKSVDMKKAYVTLKLESLGEVTLKTGIAPMGNVAPELRLVFDDLTESKFTSSYSDIDMWAKDAITLFEQAGVIGGDADTFNPNEAMTRGEFVKIIADIVGLEVTQDYTDEFKDVKGHKYGAYIAAATKAGYINGYENNTFRPNETLTRAEAVVLINRVIGHSEETAVETTASFKDLKVSHWAYDEILKVVSH